jgi:hypothetical protein
MGWFSDIVKVGAGVVGGVIGFAVGGPAGAAYGFSIGSSVASGLEGIEAAAAAKDSAKAQRRQAKLQVWQQSMENLRNYQQASSMAAVAAESSGASLESSAAQGVQSSLGSQTSFNNAMLAEGLGLSNQFYGAQRDLINAQRNAQVWSTLGSLARSAATILPQGGGTNPMGARGAYAQADRAGYGVTGGSGGPTLRPGSTVGYPTGP